jgi:hypothetical protein
MDGFHLHLLVYPFIYHFFTRMSALVESTSSNPAELFIFISFHNHFKIFWYCVLPKTRFISCSYLFWDTVKQQLKTNFIKMKMKGKRFSRWNPQSASAKAAEEAGIVFILSTISTSRFVQFNFCQIFWPFHKIFIILVLKKLLQPHLKLWNGSNFTSTKTERWDFYLHASCNSNNMISQAAQKII